MKKESTNKVKLGAFIIVVMVLLVLGIYYIGQQQQLFSRTFHISGIFKDVNGLQAGNNIRFSGITVGTIENVEIITDTSVRVDMIVDEDVRKFIKKDAKAIIGSDGLMGNKIMNITPGTVGQQEIQDNDFIGTIQPVNMDEILNKLRSTTDNAAEISSDLSDIMHNIHEGKGTIGKLFMDTVFAENLDKTIVNVKQGTKGFKQNMDAARNSILLRGYFKKKKDAEKKTDSEDVKKQDKKK
jgi:phospholipid/cholesterol/gamma-HCH transport system substrate-binding protein